MRSSVAWLERGLDFVGYPLRLIEREKGASAGYFDQSRVRKGVLQPVRQLDRKELVRIAP
jgi:hypothetical protein